ncbi:MAG TPA: methionyl-tRNA formyltransferase, partial [Planctomycetaceae bacterium]|nr:methionyl-tRNA formyltransferase [Planctomycetaceae bacterium]
VEAVGDRLRVATGQGLVRLSSLQPAGKRMLSVEEFLRGYPLKAGHRFGPP